MRPTLSFLLIVAFLAASVATAEAQRGRPTDESKTARSDSDDNETGAPADKRGAPAREAGRLAIRNGTIEGRYVALSVDAENCRIEDLRAYGTLFFSRIELPGTRCRLTRGNTSGGIELRGDSFYLRIHDAPNGLVQFRSHDATIDVTVAAGVGTNGTERSLSLAAGNLSAEIIAGRPRGDVSANFTWEPPLLALREGHFMVHPAAGSTPERRMVLDAIRNGRVGAEADVLSDNGTVVSESFVYDDVELRMRRGGQERFDFAVSANLNEGRVFVANFDPGAWSPARLRVDYNDVAGDGSLHPARISRAGSLDEVLNATGYRALYFAFEDASGWHVAVYVPTFSTHVFQVVGLPLQTVPILLYGLVIVGLVFGTGGVGVILERRRGRPPGGR